MALRKDNIQISIDIEAAAGVKKFAELTSESKRLNAEIKRLQRAGKDNTEEFKKLEKQLSEVNTELAELGGAGATMGQLTHRAKQLRREIMGLAPGTARFIEATKELKDVNTRLAQMRKETRGVAEGLDEMRIVGIKMPQWVNKMSLAFKGFVALEIIGLFLRCAQATNEMTQEVIKL
ncbi:MAG: hypothetical protein AAF738_09720, partial [Bacteroidota bacterium]